MIDGIVHIMLTPMQWYHMTPIPVASCDANIDVWHHMTKKSCDTKESLVSPSFNYLDLKQNGAIDHTNRVM